MKISHLLISSFVFTSFLFSWIHDDISSFPKTSTVSFCEGSSLKIKGSSNVNEFECALDMNALSEEIEVTYRESKDYLNFGNTQLVIPANHFDCGGKMINKDFQKLLKVDDFPEIRLALKKVMKSKTSEDCTMATIEVFICDINHAYDIPISTSKSNGGVTIDGLLTLNINDFSLDPPKKMLGVIKVSPIIEIEFSLNFKIE
ncbi:MAG: YceI family protein [Winogradskyella sp.]